MQVVKEFKESLRAEDDKSTSQGAERSGHDELVLLLKQARLAEIKGSPVEADKYFHRSLQVLEVYTKNKVWDKDRLLKARIFIYDAMGNLALQRKQLDKADNLFRDTIAGLLQEGIDKTDNSIVEISLKLAMIYAMQKKFDDARSGYRFCIDTQQQKVTSAGKDVDQDTLALLGMCMDNYARFLIMDSQFDEAMQHLEQALEIAKKVFVEDHPQHAVLLNDLATVASLKNDFTKAKENMEQAISIGEKVQSPDIPMFYVNLGTICSQLNDNEAALEYCQKGGRLAIKGGDRQTEAIARNCVQNMKKIIKKSKK